MPIAVTALASIPGLFPMTERLMIFLLPCLILGTAAGAEYISSMWPPRLRSLLPLAALVLAGAPLYAIAGSPPPYRLQHVRPILERVRAAFEPGDAIYLYYGAGQAFDYYASRFGWPQTGTVAMGRCAVGEPRDYLRELDQFRGRRRLWVIVTTHGNYKEAEVMLILTYLDRIGSRAAAFVSPSSSGILGEGAYGYLYDLSDPSRLRSAAADTVAIPRGALAVPPPRWRCYGVDRSEPAVPRPR